MNYLRVCQVSSPPQANSVTNFPRRLIKSRFGKRRGGRVTRARDPSELQGSAPGAVHHHRQHPGIRGNIGSQYRWWRSLDGNCLPLAPAAGITGRVYDANGVPVPNARVSVGVVRMCKDFHCSCGVPASSPMCAETIAWTESLPGITTFSRRRSRLPCEPGRKSLESTSGCRGKTFTFRDPCEFARGTGGLRQVASPPRQTP